MAPPKGTFSRRAPFSATTSTALHESMRMALGAGTAVSSAYHYIGLNIHGHSCTCLAHLIGVSAVPSSLNSSQDPSTCQLPSDLSPALPGSVTGFSQHSRNEQTTEPVSKCHMGEARGPGSTWIIKGEGWKLKLLAVPGLLGLLGGLGPRKSGQSTNSGDSLCSLSKQHPRTM